MFELEKPQNRGQVETFFSCQSHQDIEIEGLTKVAFKTN
jgi:hypothetical protein